MTIITPCVGTPPSVGTVVHVERVAEDDDNGTKFSDSYATKNAGRYGCHLQQNTSFKKSNAHVARTAFQQPVQGDPISIKTQVALQWIMQRMVLHRDGLEMLLPYPMIWGAAHI